MPEVVSQWTAKTWVIEGVRFKRRSTSARSGGVSSGVSCTTRAAPRDLEDALRALAIGAVDRGAAPCPSRGTKVVSIASTAKVPEPCIGTVT